MSKQQQVNQPFDYNATRERLLMSEYGRNVQNMINHVLTLTDKEERNRYAQAVIELMGQLNPHLRDVTDFKHKLWDHLFIISDFKLDVDSPFPVPSRESINAKPKMIRYPANHIKFKHYGKTVEYMIERAKTIEDPKRKAVFVASIANFMKLAYVTWNKDLVSDETIINDLKQLSNGELELAENTNLNRVDYKTVSRQTSNRDTKESSAGGRDRDRSSNRGDKRDFDKNRGGGFQQNNRNRQQGNNKRSY
ncbi:DUF4290 domain-containing protein [Solitalea koreensis]|uniref:DUF4290 domain-containing protein n=1 Tax=Solitalea koreensis TaxID=543615 RepID=A0A521E0N6_9SPHI|nr:DUF4290 domain-containing protein [Solitalea koreensis]SMO77526.1 protein of unknown function [Solitalea koreensis]